uniref:EGF-like domain-containing protein n=1 Tax=Callorhinchus milii TaxID=7868 RepID=A0A4W3ITF9_CALMI
MVLPGPGRRRRLLLLLTFLVLSSESGWARAADSSYASEIYTQTPQKLSLYSWYGNVRLFLFRVPEDTVLMRLLLMAAKGSGQLCHDVNITVHIRAGAPPVINPLQTKFEANTVAVPAHSFTMELASIRQSLSLMNISNPISGEWYVAAHLPKDIGKIELKLHHLLLLFLRIFIPEYTMQLVIQLRNCTSNNPAEKGCPVNLLIGSESLPVSHLVTINCNESKICTQVLNSPPWMKRIQVAVKSRNANEITSFEIESSLTVCTPAPAGISRTMLNNFTLLANITQFLNGKGVSMKEHGINLLNNGKSCFRNHPIIRDAMDIASVRFLLLLGPNVTVTSESPAVLILNLNTGRDNGGSIISFLPNKNATVFACLSAGSPAMSLNITSMTCHSDFSLGYLIKMNSTVRRAALRVPYPETDRWFLTLQARCPNPESDTCGKVTSLVTVSTVLSPCIGDCGTYGECRLLRAQGYLYAACSCKAGWDGWSCTDDTNAQSYKIQLLATLLLTLSNLMFLPPIAIAIHRYYFVEASVYIFNMFFSTFYHACDQPGIAVMCIMDYDTLQYCDFLGSVLSVWVTILCMAKLKPIFKYTLFVLGSLFIAMSVQLDRRGLWNLLAPCLIALSIMGTAWVYRSVKRRHCYPPTWKRWVFFILPGVIAALVAIIVYALLETKENYFYTHSIWHILVAGSVVFFLPPGEKHVNGWIWTQKFCGYQLCSDVKGEDVHIIN